MSSTLTSPKVTASGNSCSILHVRVQLLFVYNLFSLHVYPCIGDPYESQDLSSSTSLEAANLLRLWRSRMVRQFESEKRGLAYVKGSKLVRRISDPLYSPHYPAPSAEALAEA